MTELKEKSEMDLVELINSTEGFALRLNYDVADGRISDKGVGDSTSKIMKQRDEAVTELKSRIGIQTHEEMRNYITGKLKEQDQMWDKQGGELYQEGAVFKISGGGKYRSDLLDVFETVRAYLPTSGTFGPNQIILARPHGSIIYSRFDDRDIPELKKLDGVKPVYQEMNSRGIIKADEEIDKRVSFLPQRTNYSKEWHRFTNAGAVFRHSGFDETFETFQLYNLPNKKRKEKNEVVLTRSYDREMFVEFTMKDLEAMELIMMKPIYTRREGNTIYLPQLILEK